MHWQVPWAQCSFLHLIFSFIFYFFFAVRSLSNFLFYCMPSSTMALQKNTQVSHNDRQFSWHRRIMECIILFEEDSLKVPFNGCTVLTTSLPSYAMKEEKNRKITRDQACPVLCMLIALKTFSFYYIKCHRSWIIAVTLNREEKYWRFLLI